MRINTNLTAMNTYTQYTKNNNKIASSVAKLSSGYAINSASDNAAGLAISEKMRAQIRGLDQASTNAQDAISLTQTAEGSLSESTEILQRMRELSVQSSNDTNQNGVDREALQDEFSQLQSELNDISKNTTFNKKNLLDGSLASQTANTKNVTLGNSSMSVELGNVAAGSYNFNVSTKLESAAVAAKATSFQAVNGSSTMTTATAAAGANTKASSLLNGNYTMSASYDNKTSTMTITATGDNGQSFKASLTSTQLADAVSGQGTTLKFGENDDAFNLELKWTGTSYDSGSESSMDALATEIGKVSVVGSNGVDKADATYGVYANLTGADSVKLSSGMDSVTFSNGVKVNFDKLTAADVDTTNSVTGTTVSIAAGSNGFTNLTSSFSNLKASDNSTIVNGDMTIKNTTSGGKTTFTATDASGKTYTSQALTSTDLYSTANSTTVKSTITLTSTDGSESITMDLSTTSDADAASNAPAIASDATGVKMGVSNANHNFTTTFGNVYADSMNTTKFTQASDFSNTMDNHATGVSLGNFKAADGSSVAAGDMNITLSTDGSGKTTFTATDSKGNAYTTDALTSTDLSSASATKTTTLQFKAGGNAAFTMDLAITSDATAAGFTASKSDTVAVALDYNDASSSSFGVETTKNAGLTFQVGANSGDELTINIDKMDATYLGVSSLNIGTQEGASAAISSVDKAINTVSSQRAYLGAIQNRLDHKIANLDTSNQNLTSAESEIRDVDMAKEMTNFTNANILSQASTAMLAQANSLPKNVLSLLS